MDHPLRQIIIFNLISSILFIISCNSTPKTQSKKMMRGVGVAPLFQNSEAVARELAIERAKENAIKRKFGELIRSNTIVDSGIWVVGDIIRESKGIVKDYKILSEVKGENTYKIFIDAVVEKADLKAASERVIEDWDKPRVLALINESGSGSHGDFFNNYTVNELKSWWSQKGFEVQGNSFWAKTISNKNLINSKKIRVLSEGETDFDLLLAGESTCRDGGTIMKSQLHSIKFQIRLVMFEIGRGTIIGATNATAAIPHVDTSIGCQIAIKKHSKILSNQIYQKMLKKWKTEFATGKTHSISLLSKSNKYLKLHNAIHSIRAKIPGIMKITEKSFAQGNLKADIITKMKTSELIDQINAAFNWQFKNRKGRSFQYQIK